MKILQRCDTQFLRRVQNQFDCSSTEPEKTKVEVADLLHGYETKMMFSPWLFICCILTKCTLKVNFVEMHNCFY